MLFVKPLWDRRLPFCRFEAHKLARRCIRTYVSATACDPVVKRRRSAAVKSQPMCMPAARDGLRKLLHLEFQNSVVRRLFGRVFVKKFSAIVICCYTFKGHTVLVKPIR